jgi:hypothetical protein
MGLFVTLSITISTVIMTEYHYAECHIFYCNAECRYPEFRYVECRGAQ